MGCGCANCREDRFTQYEDETGGARPGGGAPARPRTTVCTAKHVFVDCPNPGTPAETLDHFGFNVSEINRPRHAPQIQRLAARIAASQSSRSPIRRVLLAGHTDPRGDDNYNFPLSSRRAEAVKKELCLRLEDLRRGLSAQIVWAIAPCGERQTGPPGQRTAEQQRRVEVFLFAGGSGPRRRPRFRTRDAEDCGVPAPPPAAGRREIGGEMGEGGNEFGYESPYESTYEGAETGYEEESDEFGYESAGESGFETGFEGGFESGLESAFEGGFESAFEDEFDREWLEMEGARRPPARRPARPPAPRPQQPARTVQPRIIFFQDFFKALDRNHFRCQAEPWAQRVSAVQSPTTTACATIGSTPFRTGRGLIAFLTAAHACLGRRIELVHVFGHGSPDGFGGRFKNMTGLYHIPITAKQRRDGGRLVTDVPTAPLATNVTFVLHNCRLAAGTDNFAKALFDHLVGALPDVRVFGHFERGCAGRNSDWKEYSSASPNGQQHNSLPASLWVPQEIRPGVPCCDPPAPPRRPTPRRPTRTPARPPARPPAPQGGRR